MSFSPGYESRDIARELMTGIIIRITNLLPLFRYPLHWMIVNQNASISSAMRELDDVSAYYDILVEH